MCFATFALKLDWHGARIVRLPYCFDGTGWVSAAQVVLSGPVIPVTTQNIARRKSRKDVSSGSLDLRLVATGKGVTAIPYRASMMRPTANARGMWLAEVIRYRCR